MKEDTKENIRAVVTLFIVCIFAIAFFYYIVDSASKIEKKNNQNNIQEIKECLDKTNDRDWCFDKFYN